MISSVPESRWVIRIHLAKREGAEPQRVICGNKFMKDLFQFTIWIGVWILIILLLLNGGQSADVGSLSYDY